MSVLRPLILLAACSLLAVRASAEPGPLACRTDPSTRLPVQLTAAGARPYRWLDGPVRVQLRREADGKVVPARMGHRWRPVAGGLAWGLSFAVNGPRQGYEVTLSFPILRPSRSVFTPGERGVIRLAARPAYTPAEYAHLGWGDGRSYVLPLVSVLDAAADRALTLALPPDPPVPHLQVAWEGARTLRLTLGHRAMGGGRPAGLRVLLLTHAADYRSALAAYACLFPAWFEPGLPRGPYEGTFWYHHIQDHPDYDEMARQRVRFLWASFWFTYLGEYLPAEREWAPYTYAKWWKLGQMMTDERINAFVKEMHDHGIGTYAYFNVTEYGGAGGKTGDTAEAERLLRERFAGALIKDQAGRPIPTWEGAMAMNPRKRYSLWPVLEEQVKRHLARLPGIDGFTIDRLDWASIYDWGHDDGQTMVGLRPAENMAGPVGEAVQQVCRLSHGAGKRVFVNQFYRVEVLRDVDGYCHENDYVRGLGYLSPYRPASAWHMRRSYAGDLLAFEAQLKQRLQWAVFPQMIAHRFPISQQAPNTDAADLMEIYAPLFEPLNGKRQMLLPHCVSATGPNDANLFVDPHGRYVVPVTSRVRFLSRRTDAAEPVTITLRVPDARRLTWARVYSADGPPTSAVVRHRGSLAVVTVLRHGTASVVVVGRGEDIRQGSRRMESRPATKQSLPARTDDEMFGWAKLGTLRDRLFPRPPAAPVSARSPAGPLGPCVVRLEGRQVGESGALRLLVDGKDVGALEGERATVALPASGRRAGAPPPVVSLAPADEGVWFVPSRVELRTRRPDGTWWRIAAWTPQMPTRMDGGLPLRWCVPEQAPVERADFEGKAPGDGHWRGRLGRTAAWLPMLSGRDAAPAGYHLAVENAAEVTWLGGERDARTLEPPPGGPEEPQATCWHAVDGFRLSVTPPDAKPYRLTLYLLDFDHNRRAMDLAVGGKVVNVTPAETDRGVYVTWRVAGPVEVAVRKTRGYNAVVSGVFVDPP